MNTENIVKHYWDCAAALKPETHTHKLLKSYYMTLCCRRAKASINLPREKFSRHTMCPRCSSKWDETNFQMKLKPQQVALTTKVKKQLEKLYEANKSTESRRTITKKQRKRAKWLRKRVLSNVEMQCELCQHKTLLTLHKPSRGERESRTLETAELEESTIVETVPAPTPVKTKKNKSKDKTAGLKLDNVQTHAAKKVTPNKDANQRRSNQKTAAVIVKPQANNKSVSKTAAAPKQQAKHAANLTQPLKSKKKKQHTKVVAAPVAQNVKSKTQKQNSLLQLAALLKAQTTSKAGANVAQKKLESLLK
ncbi:uncharacterized protein LOC128866682 [Anastrepha ludens]|uniref:uncharacterized protein LOC128866682 n=1 Tax=Anastrepha ludens TaxID=28586 RepID=UPI0023B1ED79|nr:uncharacterized protein LOC128866682 [Anastrepha ludens]